MTAKLLNKCMKTGQNFNNMTLLSTNGKTEVPKPVHNYLVRKWCESMTPKEDTPSGKVKIEINGTEHEFDLTNCFDPIHEKYKEAAKRKYQTSLKYKYK